jgi:Tfp pilus assembly protein PilF
LAAQLAALSIGRGDEVAAREYFEQALMFNPGDSQLLFALALFAARTGDDDARRNSMEKALRYRPDSLPLRVELAREYLRQGDRDSALGLAVTAPQGVPKVYRATRYRIESMAGDWQAAAEDARWLTETDPEKQHFWLWRAEAEGRTGNPAALRSALIRAIKLDRQNKLKPNHLAGLVLRSGDRGQIEATLAELRTQLPADPRILALGESPLLAPDRLKRLHSKASPASKPPRDRFVELDLAQVMDKFSDRRFSDLEDIDQDGVADLIRDNPWDSSREKPDANDVLGSLIGLIELEETGIGLLDTPSAKP